MKRIIILASVIVVAFLLSVCYDATDSFTETAGEPADSAAYVEHAADRESGCTYIGEVQYSAVTDKFVGGVQVIFGIPADPNEDGYNSVREEFPFSDYLYDTFGIDEFRDGDYKYELYSIWRSGGPEWDNNAWEGSLYHIHATVNGADRGYPVPDISWQTVRSQITWQYSYKKYRCL